MEVIGCGVFYGICEVLSIGEDVKKFGLILGIDGKIMVVQGFGNVGFYIVMIFQDEGGMVIVGVFEVEGVIYKKDGIDIYDLLKFCKDIGFILNYFGVKLFFKECCCEVMEFECDVLVFVVLENQIDGDNVVCIKVKIIVEVVNGLVMVEVQ